MAFPAILEERRFFPLEPEREPLALLFDRERERERFLEADRERFLRPFPLADFDLLLDLLEKETIYKAENPLYEPINGYALLALTIEPIDGPAHQ